VTRSDLFASVPDLQLPEPDPDQPRRAAIVGAGVCGLVTARLLQRAGWDVTVFDKARGPGGRLSTRREKELQFDLGAQYFVARDKRFQALVDSLAKAGAVGAWAPRFVQLDGEGNFLPDPAKGWLVGTPRMSALTAALAEGCTTEYSCRIEILEQDFDGWRLATEDGRDFDNFEQVLLTCPAPQAATLAMDFPEVSDELEMVTMLPCWAVMVGLDATLDLPFDAAAVDASPLSWIACNSSKPGRPARSAWVLHASPEFSIEHEDDEPAAIARVLTTEFLRLIDKPGLKPSLSLAHRWLYARPDEPLGRPCLYDPELRLGAAGDWCVSANVEGAFLSAVALAETVANSAPPDQF